MFPCRALYNRIMENPDDNLLTTMSGGVEELLRPETKNFGILAEGVVADHMKGLHCDLYSVGHLNDRAAQLNRTMFTLIFGLKIRMRSQFDYTLQFSSLFCVGNPRSGIPNDLNLSLKLEYPLLNLMSLRSYAFAFRKDDRNSGDG